MYVPYFMKISESRGYKKVIAEKTFKRGDTLFVLEGNLSSQPSKYSIQTGLESHLQPHENNNEWKFVNHSCNPNACIDTAERKMKALKDIHEGEEICFNYNTTEYEISSPFQCNCGTEKCYGKIKGFKYLSEEQQQLLLPYTASHINILNKKKHLVN